MKILVIKTDYGLTKDAKEEIREEVSQDLKRGMLIIDGGLGFEVIEIDKSALLDEKGIAASFEQQMKKVGEMTVDGKYVPYEERKIDTGIEQATMAEIFGTFGLPLQKGNMK
ncbi:hypothetical protein MKY83_13315 [Bacillus sp. FSL M8-0266]|uniref:hypothetical protein n=1 Tax=Bacillus TaxID=1386 RepID=UPI0007EEE02D|nr:hypothetical protein [Bacillus pumilus]MBU8574972.1 hypothetical protein [Bacillus pumilus]MBU8609404.1 hypothetical protein [Bacillus pumilus]MED1111112.1 hypothetical protein [Bacillus pumilus]OBS85387.1 hypothetical protein BAY68_06640 [Bacillus pumilus]